ncbi:MAG: endonuclease domain-containing protein [Pseudomonadota bacterium]|nr:endonuclease domain-containing protein [Pseudomonadota bacterium]
MQALVRACHLSFGVSYYKAALPARIVAHGVVADEVGFWDLLYGEGLGEFYFRNGLPVPDRPGFGHPDNLAQRSDAPATTPAAAGPPHEATLVLIGGGKDSGLVAEIVRASGVRAAALALGDSPWMERSAAAAGLLLHRVERRIDPLLFALNASGAWNGHVPVSACIAAVSLLVARAAGFTDVLVGNERGADHANLLWQGREVNHQWSKSSRYERALQDWCGRHVGVWPRYASLLRPLGEVRIAREFAHCPDQHPSFTSCNRNFRLDPASRPERWCGECAKCVFVALILSPHLDEAQAHAIFGQDILARAANRPHLEALLGLADVKPWDCVGTPQECWLSLLALHRQGRLPAALADLPARAPAALQGGGFAAAWEHELQADPAPTLTAVWRARLDAYLGTG